MENSKILQMLGATTSPVSTHSTFPFFDHESILFNDHMIGNHGCNGPSYEHDAFVFVDHQRTVSPTNSGHSSDGSYGNGSSHSDISQCISSSSLEEIDECSPMFFSSPTVVHDSGHDDNEIQDIVQQMLSGDAENGFEDRAHQLDMESDNIGMELLQSLVSDEHLASGSTETASETESSASGSMSADSDSTKKMMMKKRKRTKSETTILQEIANEANEVASKHSKISEWREELTELEKNPEMNESEKRRRKRLIKNRESAQVSRERKKMYVKNLEQKVTDLTTRNEELEDQMVRLERANELLKVKIRQLENGEPTDNLADQDCSVKHPCHSSKHQTSSSASFSTTAEEEDVHYPKNPISLPDMTNRSNMTSMMNPFDPTFWALMMGFQRKQQKSEGDDQVSSASLAGRNVVMFIVLFCLAFMVACPDDMEQCHAFDSSSLTSNDALTGTVSHTGASENTRHIGRNILTVQGDDTTIHVKFLSNTCVNMAMNDEQRSLMQEQFNDRIMVMGQNLMKNVTEKDLADSDVSFQFDDQTEELTVSMDNDEPQETVHITKRRRRIKQRRTKNRTEEGLTLSHRLFRTICNMVDEIGASSS